MTSIEVSDFSALYGPELGTHHPLGAHRADGHVMEDNSFLAMPLYNDGVVANNAVFLDAAWLAVCTVCL